jgi:hypothetical protein
MPRQDSPNPPGLRLLDAADLFLGRDPMIGNLHALVADWQYEWASATTPRARAWIRVRGTGAFWRAIAVSFLHRWLTPPGWRLTWLTLVIAVGGVALQTVAKMWLPPAETSGWTEALMHSFVMTPFFVALSFQPARLTLVAPESGDRVALHFFQFAFGWWLLAITWTVWTAASGWIVIGTAVSAVSGWAVARRQRQWDERQ